MRKLRRLPESAVYLLSCRAIRLLKQSAASVDRVDAPAAGAIGFGVVGGTEAAEFAAGGGNNLRAAGIHFEGRRLRADALFASGSLVILASMSAGLAARSRLAGRSPPFYQRIRPSMQSG